MIRFVPAIVLLLLSLLTVMKAPTNFFWKTAVAITEFPWIPMALVLALGIWTWWSPNYKWILLGCYALAFALFSLPVVNTYVRTSNLDKELTEVFGNTSGTGQLKRPFSFSKMFSGKDQMEPETIVFKEVDGQKLHLDYFKAEPNGNALLPCMIAIHGGSWAMGDQKELPDLYSYLAKRGINVISIEYRLAPRYHFPAPLEDLKDVLNLIHEKTNDWRIDTNKIVLMGRSAGGQIALMAGYTFNDPGIKGVISFYAPADMAWGARIKTNKLVLDADKVLSDYIGGSVNDVPEKYDLASAPQFVTDSTIPTLLIHGPIDAMVSYNHSVRLKKVLDEHKVPNYLLDLPNTTHGSDYNFNGPGGQTSTFAIERFIQAVTSN